MQYALRRAIRSLFAAMALSALTITAWAETPAADNAAEAELLAEIEKLREIELAGGTKFDREKQQRWSGEFNKLGRGSLASHDRLVRLLDDDEPYVRATVAAMLGVEADERSVDPLIQTLGDEHPIVRAAAAAALGRIGDRRATPALVKSMYDHRPAVREEALRALGQVRDPRATRHLIEAIKLRDEVRSCDVNVPLAIYELWPEHQYEGRYDECAPRALVQIGEPSVDKLIEALRDPAGDNHQFLAWDLGRIGTPAVGPLIDCMSDESAAVRRRAALALGIAGDPRAMEILTRAEKDADAAVREAAATARQQITAAERESR